VSHPPLRANRDFRLLWIGGLLSGLGGQMATLALPLLILAQTDSPARAGLVGSVTMAATLVALLPGGAVADATERRRLMLACQLAATALSGLLTVAVLANRPALALILLVTVSGAVLSTFYGPAAAALLRSAVPAEHLGAAISRLQARSAAARLAGPLLGGALFGLGPALPFLAETCGLIASFGCVLAVRARAAPTTPDTGGRTRRHLTAGIVFCWQQRYLRTVLVLFGAGLNSAIGGVMLAAIASSASRDPSGRSSGAVVALASAGSLAGSLLAARTRAHERPRSTTLLTCWTCTAGVALLAFTPHPLLVGAILGTCLLVAAVGNVVFATAMLLVTPPHLVGRVQSAAALISLATQPVGPLAGGLLLDHFGPGTTFAVFAVVLGCCAAAATIAPGLHHAPYAPSAPSTPATAGLSDARSGSAPNGPDSEGR
jgi:MFS family permease